MILTVLVQVYETIFDVSHIIAIVLGLTVFIHIIVPCVWILTRCFAKQIIWIMIDFFVLMMLEIRQSSLWRFMLKWPWILVKVNFILILTYVYGYVKYFSWIVKDMSLCWAFHKSASLILGCSMMLLTESGFFQCLLLLRNPKIQASIQVKQFLSLQVKNSIIIMCRLSTAHELHADIVRCFSGLLLLSFFRNVIANDMKRDHTM